VTNFEKFPQEYHLPLKLIPLFLISKANSLMDLAISSMFLVSKVQSFGMRICIGQWFIVLVLLILPAI